MSEKLMGNLAKFCVRIGLPNEVFQPAPNTKQRYTLTSSSIIRNSLSIIAVAPHTVFSWIL